ncbi:MAG: 50S ribosomal protein L11 methyltransferase [Crocinitomicaceae bacterium]|jgi:ribosomal protein L11 methyltransferase|nr:50S ribosomal protein L11 methyltransferase [Crocinitomicaceae bacterium]
MDTVELNIQLSPKDPWSDIIIAELSEHGFDSFVTTDEGVLAYAPISINTDEVVKESLLGNPDGFECTIVKTIIPHQNWNAEWEKNFSPVFIEEYATILAPFHDGKDAVGMKVIIQPQMSFGTGHHQTTWMMTKALFELGEMPSTVLDMGTGTGVLAVYAAKLGAKEVLAIDIEEWSAENARENVERNGCSNIECLWGDIDLVKGRNFGLIIANINKNILKQHMEVYSNALETNGTLLLSGFFVTDVDEMTNYCEAYKLKQTKVFTKDEWACIQLIKAK